MTDKEIIQALRYCKKETCADGGLCCPLSSDADCITHLCEATIDLIERRKRRREEKRHESCFNQHPPEVVREDHKR